MRVHRISRPEYVSTALLGNGSAIAPGRWNSAGVRLAYSAASVSLAMLEILVHMHREDVPDGRRLLGYEIPDDAIHVLPESRWPKGWNLLPYSAAVRAVGDSFIVDDQHLALRVPSAVARGEFNVLVNPMHPRFAQITLVADEPLAMDPRLFG